MPLDRRAILGAGTWVSKMATFSTTDETVEVDMEGFKHVVIVGLQIFSTATPDAGDSTMLIDEAALLDSKGILTVPATGTITLRRLAGGASGLEVLVTFLGEFNGRANIRGLGIIRSQRSAYTTTGTTVEVGCGELTKIRVIGTTIYGASADVNDNAHFYDETIDSNGVINVPASNSITLTRVAAGLSGLTNVTVMVGS